MNAATFKKFVVCKLENSRGDDLYRARRSFGGLSPQQMQEPYGQSGYTRAQILADYEARDAEHVDAIAYAKALPE